MFEFILLFGYFFLTKRIVLSYTPCLDSRGLTVGSLGFVLEDLKSVVRDCLQQYENPSYHCRQTFSQW